MPARHKIGAQADSPLVPCRSLSPLPLTGHNTLHIPPITQRHPRVASVFHRFYIAFLFIMYGGSSVMTVRPAPIASYPPTSYASSSSSASNMLSSKTAGKKNLVSASSMVKRKRSTADDGASDVSDESIQSLSSAATSPVKATSTSGTIHPAATMAPSAKTRDGPKKKKANRACAHCQKSHLTCDDCTSLSELSICAHLLMHIAPFFSSARPCQRCIKRGMADKCTEGHRKKAKYLLDELELGQ